MARIFYWSVTGYVYGVHPDDGPPVTLPVGVAELQVAGSPSEIVWPPFETYLGREQWTRVVNNTLVARTDILRANDPKELLKSVRAKLTTLGFTDAELRFMRYGG